MRNTDREKVLNKHHITLDNSYMLLYTVYSAKGCARKHACKHENELLKRQSAGAAKPGHAGRPVNKDGLALWLA